MDLQTLTALSGAVVIIASTLTNVLPTPGPAAPAWWRYAYQVVEWLALVGRGTKDNPTAAASVLASVTAFRAGNITAGMSAAVDAYGQLASRANKSIGAVGVILAALTLVGLGVTACQGDGTLTAKARAAIEIACQVDAQVQPVVVTVAPQLIADLSVAATVDQTLVHPAVQAACAALSGTPTGVVSTASH